MAVAAEQSEVANADVELQKVLSIACHVGAMSGDEVFLSYTSLLIGLLWSDDPTSKWIQERLEPLGVRTSSIYAYRHIDENQRLSILKKVSAGEPLAPSLEATSISARTLLREARSVASEVGLQATLPLGTRHVAAVYFFKNPPAHVTQFAQWGFDKEAWRREFANFILTTCAQEAAGWTQILVGYLPTTDPLSQQVDGTFLGNFVFETECIGVLRALESETSSKTPSLLSSESLLDTLVRARTVSDCSAFADLVGDRLSIKTTVAISPNGPSFAGSGSSYPASRGFKNVLDRARSLARSTTGTDAIGVRHIIASILVDPDSTANQKLVRSGVSLPLMRNKLLKHFTKRWLNDDGLQWQLIMVGSTLPLITDVQSDTADRGEDRLDVSRYARAFATIIAAEKVNPPFSVGIFGDWGSGKSFFMRLMIEHTSKMSAFADVGQDRKRLFCRRVVPIQFNAWHYAESELLASLVQTILLGLRSAIVGDDGDSELMDRVLSRLEIAKVARGEAERQLLEANQECERSQHNLQEASEKAQKKAEAVQQLQLKDIVDAVRSATLPSLGLDDALTVGEKYLGLTGLDELKKTGQKTVGDVIGVIHDVRIARARARSAWDWLVRAPVDWRGIGPWVAAALTVLVAGSLVAIRLHDSWPAFYGLAINVAGIVALAVRWAKWQLRTVSKGLDQFDAIRREVDQAFQRERLRTQADLEIANQDHANAMAEVEKARKHLNEAQLHVTEAEKELRESRSISRIAKLLEDRLTGKSYERYLGIVAAVRADFQRLSDLMRSMRSDSGTDIGSLQPVDRIVLYIDDLDRCPGDKVVAVLEAIHLLLTFELFVVVVGVDIRWAAKSLAEKYPQHLTPGIYEGGQKAPLVSDGVSALDYLEKIFQIPFWLPPMEEDASRSMIVEMVPRIAEAPGAQQADAAAESVVVSQSAQDQETGKPSGPRSPDDEQRRNAQSLVIEPEERMFMLQLAGAVGKSPRRLKRFLNTYRILKASLDRLQQETFVLNKGGEGEYRAAMVLLAMITGAPRSSLRMLEFLANCVETSPLADLEAHINQSADPAEAKYIQAALTAYKNAQPNANLGVLRSWAPEVARFSFRSGRT
jgi:hypothetical protein